MRIKRTKTEVFKFAELSEDAQDEAIERFYDLNVNYEWWQSVYEDAKRAGLEITSFDCDHGGDIKGKLTGSLTDALKSILSDHGDPCETWKTAKAYQDRLDVIETRERVRQDEDRDGSEYIESIEDLTIEFTHDILEDYLVMLRQEYDYQTSREAIVESIEANDYEFTTEGELA